MKQAASDLTSQAALVVRVTSGFAALLALAAISGAMVHGPNLQALVAYQFASVLVSATALVLTFERHFAEFWQVEAALFFVSQMVICTGLVLAISGASHLIVLATVVPIVAVLLPWSWQVQLFISLTCLVVAMLAARLAPSATLSNFFWFAMLAEVLVSVIAAFLLEREREQQVLYCQALAADEEQFRSLIENSPDGLMVITASGTIAFVGPSVDRLLGYAAASLLRRNLFEFVHHDDVPAFRDTLDRCSEPSRSSYRIEVRCRHAQSTWRTIEAVGRQLDFGKEPLFVFNWRDITDRAAQEARLRESEEKFRKIFQYSTNVITISSLTSGKYIDVNDEFVNQSGYERTEAIGRTPLELGLWAQPHDYVSFLVEFLQHYEIRDRETTFRTKDGTVRRALLSASRLDLNGKAVLLGIATLFPHGDTRLESHPPRIG